MILPLPEKFDANEWFVLISILFFLAIFIILPKKFSTMFTVLLMLFMVTLAKTTDYLISANIPFDLYDYNDSPKLDLFDEFLQFVLYPLVGYVMIYTYDWWIQQRRSKVIFFILSVVMSVGYEWLSVLAHVFTYKGWNLYYSAIAYIVLIAMSFSFYHWLKKQA